jgi:putative endonuclease
MLSNENKTIYTGVTGDLFRRVWEHRELSGSKFTSKHQLSKLVWFEETDDVAVAIAREKQVKNWHREWKLALVENANPLWLDLSIGWYGVGHYSESSSE